MKKWIFIVLLLPFLPGSAFCQSVPEVDFRQLEPLLHKANDTTYVVNFWATWCKPCVEEMPHFVKAASEMDDRKLKFIFVSLDFPGQKAKVSAFVQQHKLPGKVFLLNDPDSNAWIPKVNAGWSGALPATLIYRGADKSFFEGALSYEQLIQTIKNKQL